MAAHTALQIKQPIALRLDLPARVRVQYSAGAYNTQRVHGHSASSTMSAGAAADRLAGKLAAAAGLAAGQLRARELHAKGLQAGATVWSIEAAPPDRATARANLLAAGYRTGASSANAQPRCQACQHAGEVPGLQLGLTRHDRFCGLHMAKVKTHGCCQRFARQEG